MSLFSRRNHRVAVVKIEGIISDGDALGAGRARIIEALKQAERKRARAVVARINSPGGTVAACQEVYAQIVRLKQKGIPVVASMGDVAASGGVYVSMAADEIIANPGSVTGSIGVIMRSSNLSDLYHKVGISPKVIKSGPHKDMLATYRSFSEVEQTLLQDVINDSHDQFVDIVATARKKPRSEIDQIADGRILTGRQALKAGLVDSIGDLETAVERAASLAHIERRPKVIVLGSRKRIWQRLFGPFAPYGRSLFVGERLAGIPLWILPTL